MRHCEWERRSEGNGTQVCVDSENTDVSLGADATLGLTALFRANGLSWNTSFATCWPPDLGQVVSPLSAVSSSVKWGYCLLSLRVVGSIIGRKTYVPLSRMALGT